MHFLIKEQLILIKSAAVLFPKFDLTNDITDCFLTLWRNSLKATVSIFHLARRNKTWKLFLKKNFTLKNVIIRILFENFHITLNHSLREKCPNTDQK